MNFAEIRFWVALSFGLILVFLFKRISGNRHPAIDKSLLFILGVSLLAYVGLETVLTFLYVSQITYWGTQFLARSKSPKILKFLLAFLQVAPLIWFKYIDFIGNGIFQLENDMLRGILIPVGISFYTFQCMSFSWDVLIQKNASYPSWLNFMNFAGFFPQIVAGPIERKDHLLPQMEKFSFQFSGKNLDHGIKWIVTGLFFKLCLADNLAQYSQPGQIAPSAWNVWYQNVLFGLRIYFDFAGYSLVALGMGRVFGINLTVNFLSPYTQTNITSFWRCWHVTLSQWFRDYIYFPLGGNKMSKGIVPLLAVFFISGIWHGAGWNFIFWGLLHGLLILIHRGLQKIPILPILGWGITMVGVFYAWLFFYQTDVAVLKQNLLVSIQPQSYSPSGLKALISAISGGDKLVLFSFVSLSGIVLLLEWIGRARFQDPYKLLTSFPCLLVMVTLTILLAPGVKNAFIYFAF